MSDPVLAERHGPVAVVRLNRPKAMNALDAELLEALLATLGALGEDREVRAVVVTGEGRAFAAGADIAAMSRMRPTEAEAFSRLGHGATAALEALPVPTVAAVNGVALGGGCELACACDWVYAARRARFGQPEVGLGLLPGFGGTSRLARRVGPGWARELVLTGEAVDAETARAMGLVNRLFDDGEAAVEAAVRVGETVARKGPVAVARAKRLLVETADADARVAHACEQQAFGAVFATDDREEGLAAFLEKRDPRFEGR